ncbi:hypothetical protein [Ferrimonas balearica]|uniref:hypothetical protein n=1 Tax=Ferrimonas balearica TaxID=44012 RepID=UPI001C99D89C|nr:hypothetical protein [Ferrimonas balearica]MBY5992427.1 hypothetical protein [Ferrimonas balearica]
MSFKSLLGKVLRDGVLEKGLIDTVKPALADAKPAVDEAREAADQLLTEAGVLNAPDPATDPKGALAHQLNALVACLLQRPKSQAYYLMGELAALVPQVLAAHPRLGGLMGLARALGVNLGRPGGGHGEAAAGLSTLLGGGRMARTLASSGQAMLNGRDAYEVHASQVRQWADLTPLQQAVVEQCGVLNALLEAQEEPEQTAELNQGIDQLEAQLRQQDETLYQGLDAAHQAQLDALLQAGLCRQPH